MGKYTKEDIFNMVEEEDVEFIRLQFTDMYGNLKNIAITVPQLERALNNECMFDGSSVQGFVRVDESDMYLYPDLDTFTVFPWRPQDGKVARFLCDVYKADETPFGGDSRYILKKVCREAASMGFTFDVGPELEFFLFETDEHGEVEVRTYEKAGYFDVGPMDTGENFRRDMVLTLEEMGYEVEATHHEAAPGQHEIDFKYGEALMTADSLMTYKLAIRTIAKRHGMHATFMPKPIDGIDGSGMHLNMSLRKDGINIFTDMEDPHKLSQEAYYFMGGLLKHIKGMTLLLNPTINSYKRLIPGYEAPVYLSWSVQNRSPLIRIPASKGNTRIELRSPDPSANPYIALALCLAAGLDGIKNKILPPPEATGNLYKLNIATAEEQEIDRLPVNMGEAIKAMEADPFVLNVLGEEYSKCYLKAKKKEWDEYCRQVSQWEIDHYLYSC